MGATGRRIRWARNGAMAIAFLGAAYWVVAAAIWFRNPVSTGRTPESGRSTPTVVVLEHDFGVVAPQSLSTHTFSVHNDTRHDWTLDRTVRPSCSCTVVYPASDVVPAGGDANFGLAYRAPSRNLDAHQRTWLHFMEPSAPRVQLEVSARVRRPATVEPDAVRFQKVGLGETAEQAAFLLNYSQNDWNLPVVGERPRWVHAAIDAIDANETPSRFDDARQAWRLTIQIDTSTFAPGRHAGQLELATDVGDVQVGVDVDTLRALRVIPERLFFGSIPPGEEVSSRVTVHFTADSAPRDGEQPVVEHDLGSRLSVHWKRLNAQVWELDAVLRGESVDSDEHRTWLNGTVRVSTPSNSATSDTIELPVLASLINQ